MTFRFNRSALWPLAVCTTVALVLVGQAPTGSSPAHAANMIPCEAVPEVMNQFLENHQLHTKLTRTIENRFVDEFVRWVDGSKSLLLESEARSLRKRLRRAFADAKAGRCEELLAIQKDRVRWHKGMEDHVRAVLEAPQLQVDESIVLEADAEDRKRPKTAKERDELRRKLIHFQLANYLASDTEEGEAKKKLVHRYELITKRVEELDPADVNGVFLNVFSAALDPHSSYLSAEDLEDFRISMQLSLDGIGAVLGSRDGFTTIREVVPGGAADREGTLKAKDQILAVAQGPDAEAVDVVDMSLRDVVRMIRGKKGTQVTLTILRKGEKTETFKVTIVRDKIDLKQRAAKIRYETRVVDGKELKLAVLDLPSFYGGRNPTDRNSSNDLRKLLVEAKSKGVDGVVLDVSMNGGGLLQQAVDTSGLFVRKGPIVAVEGRGTPRKILNDVDAEMVWSGPLVVLTSRVSASASEILAGAIADYGRGVVVGDGHTFGKGTVQNIQNLPPGFGAVKVTTSLFFVPGGNSTQHAGVPSDIVIPPPFDVSDISESNRDYALPTARTKPFLGTEINAADSKEQFTPVSSRLIKKLATRSKQRVAKSKAFEELAADTKKAVERGKTIRIADILNDSDGPDADKEADGEADKGDEVEELSPHAEEALNILADLVSAQKLGALPKTLTNPTSD